MDYKLCEQLKNAGFPQNPFWQVDVNAWGGSWYYLFVPEGCPQNVFADPDDYKKGIARGDLLIKIPSLTELINEVPLAYLDHNYITDGSPEWEAKEWEAGEITQDGPRRKGYGRTPAEALGRLYLLLRA